MLYELEDIREFMKQKCIHNIKFCDLSIDPIKFVRPLGIFKIDKKDPYHWIIRMWGPFESIYKNGIFSITIHFPDDFPNKAPIVNFNTKIYHLQVSPSGQSICAKFLKIWKKETSIIELLVGIYLFFTEYQNPFSPYDGQMANLYKTNINEFNGIVKKWVLEYAKPSDEDLLLTSKTYENI